MADETPPIYSQEEEELAKLREEATQPTEEAPSDSPPDEVETKADEPEVETDTQQEPDTKEEEKPKSENRYQKLIERRKEAESRAEKLQAERDSLMSMVDALKQQGYTKKEAEELAPDMGDFKEVTQDEYQDELNKRAEAVVERKLQEARRLQEAQQNAQNFQNDLKTIEEKYPILNPDAEEYDEKFESAVGKYYQALAERNPGIRLTDVVQEVINLRENGLQEAKARTVDKVAKQAASQAASPTGGRTEVKTAVDRLKDFDPNSADAEKELEALRKEIGVAY